MDGLWGSPKGYGWLNKITRVEKGAEIKWHFKWKTKHDRKIALKLCIYQSESDSMVFIRGKMCNDRHGMKQTSLISQIISALNPIKV